MTELLAGKRHSHQSSPRGGEEANTKSMLMPGANPLSSILSSRGEEANASSVLRAGVDEAGRGPLAGPLAVAAVILDPARPITGLDDSKKLSEAKREALYPLILERALAYCIVLVEPEEIDSLNIFRATMTGMRRALAGQ